MVKIMVTNNIKVVGNQQKYFWSLGRSLSSKIKLSDKQLKETRESFSKNWPKA